MSLIPLGESPCLCNNCFIVKWARQVTNKIVYILDWVEKNCNKIELHHTFTVYDIHYNKYCESKHVLHETEKLNGSEQLSG